MTQTAIEWAKEHGRRFTWRTQLDNYEPSRDSIGGEGWSYINFPNPRDERIILVTAVLKDETKSIYLVDDGRTVEPFFVAGYKPGEHYLILSPFPTNFDKGGSPILRADNGQPVDFDNWQLGPRRAYHLKIKREPSV